MILEKVKTIFSVDKRKRENSNLETESIHIEFTKNYFSIIK